MSAMCKVVHLTSVHGRYDQRIFRKECRGLVRSGCDVTMVVADDKADEIVSGVKILSVGAVKGRVARALIVLPRIFCVAKSLNGDVYQVHDPELLVVALGLRVVGKKVIFDMHEDAVVQISIKSYLNSVQRFLFPRIYGFFERFSIRRISGLVTATAGLYEKYGYLAKRGAVVQNYVDTTLFPERDVSFDKAVIFHPGGLSWARGLENMVGLARSLPSGSEVLLAGRLEDGYLESDVAPAIYLGMLTESEVQEIYARANIGVILYNDVGQYGGATAVKVYEYMAAGMPVIMPDHGEWPEFNRKVQCGLNVKVNDSGAVAAAITWLVANPDQAKALGRNGRRYVLENYSWTSSLVALLRIYEQVLGRNLSVKREVV